MARVTQSSSRFRGFRTKSPCHFPATLFKSVIVVGCHCRVSLGAVELQATMTCTAKITATISKLRLNLVILISCKYLSRTLLITLAPRPLIETDGGCQASAYGSARY